MRSVTAMLAKTNLIFSQINERHPRWITVVVEVKTFIFIELIRELTLNWESNYELNPHLYTPDYMTQVIDTWNW